MWMKNVEYSCCVLVDGGWNACIQFACKPFNVAQTAIKGSYMCYAKFFATKHKTSKKFVSIFWCAAASFWVLVFLQKFWGTKQAQREHRIPA
jgi:hypothetical protein